jgi:hypothetical protein
MVGRMTRFLMKTNPKGGAASAAFVLLKGAEKHPEQTKDAIIRDSRVGASFVYTLLPIYNLEADDLYAADPGTRVGSKEEMLASRAEREWHHP